MGIRIVALVGFMSAAFAADFVDVRPFYWLDDRLGLDVEGTSIADIWYRYAKICRKNLIVSTQLKGKLRAELDPMTCDDLLPFLQDASGVEIDWKHGVGTVKKQTSRRKGTLFVLKNRRAEEAVNQILKGVLKKEQYTVLSPQRLLLTVVPDQQAHWNDVLKAFDQPQKQLEWHIVLVRLSHHRAREIGIELSPLSWGIVGHHAKPIMLELHALEQQGEAHIVVQHHAPMVGDQPLRLEAIEEIPYTVQDGWGQQGVLFKTVGLKVLMTPKTHHKNQHSYDVKLEWKHANETHLKQAPSVDALILESRVELNVGKPIGMMSSAQSRGQKHRHCPSFLKRWKHLPKWLCHRNKAHQHQHWWVLMWLEKH